MTVGAPPLTGDLTTIRDFLAPAVADAVASLRLPAGSWVLDAGTGGGGALPALVAAIGAAGTVRAVDLDPHAVELARSHASRHRVASRVSVEQGDVLDLALGVATGPGHGFDAIWAGEVVAPDVFVDPAATVVALAGALRPGGVLALFHRNQRQAVLLPGHARIERLARSATERWSGVPATLRHHPDRHLCWLRDAGLERPDLRVFPRVAFRLEVDRAARVYLERTVWPQMQDAVRSWGAEVGMSGPDVDELHMLTTPGSARYVLDDPGWYALYPTVLVSGRRGRGGRR